MEYVVSRASGPAVIDADWDKPFWADVKPLEINNYMGDKPEHMPRTQAKVVYDDEAIYVIFRVEDRYIRAKWTNRNESVWEDSCCEFFLTPGGDIADGYFNFEINCIATMLLFHQKSRGVNCNPVAEENASNVQIASSLYGRIDPEIDQPTTWTLEYRIPYSALQADSNFTKPAPGVIWKGNFYKCGDETSHPHWITWNVIDLPQPDFHRPDFFGTLRFA